MLRMIKDGSAHRSGNMVVIFSLKHFFFEGSINKLFYLLNLCVVIFIFS
jgi:hypothetical protein